MAEIKRETEFEVSHELDDLMDFMAELNEKVPVRRRKRLLPQLEGDIPHMDLDSETMTTFISICLREGDLFSQLKEILIPNKVDFCMSRDLEVLADFMTDIAIEFHMKRNGFAPPVSSVRSLANSTPVATTNFIVAQLPVGEAHKKLINFLVEHEVDFQVAGDIDTLIDFMDKTAHTVENEVDFRDMDELLDSMKKTAQKAADLSVNLNIEDNDEIRIDLCDMTSSDQESENEFNPNLADSAEVIEDSSESEYVEEEEEQEVFPLQGKEYAEENENAQAVEKKVRVRGGSGMKKKHECDGCKKAFVTSDQLLVHARTHTKEKPYECDVCKKWFTQVGHLRRHAVIHTGERPYACEVCKTRFADSTTLRRHMPIHTGEKKFECDVCKRRFNRNSQLQGHKRIHTGERPHKCEVCKKTFTQASILRRHMQIHTGETPCKSDVCKRRFMSDVCKKRFTDVSILHTHERIHSGEKLLVERVADFQVSGDIGAVDVDDKAAHQVENEVDWRDVDELLESTKETALKDADISKSLSMERTEEIPGDLCVMNRSGQENENSFNDNVPDFLEVIEDLDVAGYDEEEEPEVFPLQDADDSEENENTQDIEKNIRVCGGNLTKKNECEVCHKEFSRRSILLVHTRTHTKEMPYLCDLCKARFSRAEHLQMHKRMHTGEQPYECEFCKKRFVEFDHLLCHIRVHTGETVYECDVCKRRFETWGGLRTHERIHKRERSYECGVCKKRFIQYDDLSVHEGIHRVISYECYLCQNRFKRLEHLTLHITHCRKNFTRSEVSKKDCVANRGGKDYDL